MDRTPSGSDLLTGAMAFRAGRMDRRRFLALVAAAGVLPHLVKAGDAHAAANEIVLWNWGGQAEKCHADAVGAPFTARTGMPLKFDTSGPLQGKIKEMVQSGKVTADVCDADLFDAIALGPQDILEPIDYGIVQKSRVLDGFALDYGVSVVFYGYAFMYDTQAFGANPPQNWADFFDLSKFPGKRSLYKWGNGSIEAALMADGVPMKEVYPCDVPRALAKVKSIKADTIFWGSPSEVAQMMQNGEMFRRAIRPARRRWISSQRRRLWMPSSSCWSATASRRRTRKRSRKSPKPTFPTPSPPAPTSTRCCSAIRSGGRRRAATP